MLFREPPCSPGGLDCRRQAGELESAESSLAREPSESGDDGLSVARGILIGVRRPAELPLA